MDLRANCSTSRFNQFCWELINPCLFGFSIATSNSKALGSDTSGSAVCVSVCLTSLTPFTFSSWQKWLLHLTIRSPHHPSHLYHISSRLVTLLKITDTPVQVSDGFFIVLLVSRSSIIAFRYSCFLFLKYLLASHLTMFRLSKFLWFLSCNHLHFSLLLLI